MLPTWSVPLREIGVHPHWGVLSAQIMGTWYAGVWLSSSAERHMDRETGVMKEESVLISQSPGNTQASWETPGWAGWASLGLAIVNGLSRFWGTGAIPGVWGD